MYIPSLLRTSSSSTIIRMLRSSCIYKTPTSIKGHHQVQPHVISTISCTRVLSTTSLTEFIPIYKFPYIVHATAICRLKLYQTGITIMMLPVTTAFYLTGLTTASQCQVAGLTCGLACAMLYIMGGFFQRLVGIMYVNIAENKLKISHLTFMGRRRDFIVPIEDVVPIAEIGKAMNPRNVYLHLKFYSNKQTYYYIVRYGGVLQPKLFAHVFGEYVLKLCPQTFQAKKTEDKS